MRHSVPFNTHAFVKRLTSAGVPEAQAEVHAEVIADLVDDQFTTKRDLSELELRLKHDLTLRFGAMLAASVAIVVALVKLL